LPQVFQIDVFVKGLVEEGEGLVELKLWAYQNHLIHIFQTERRG
jgi:hypothetical protein